MKDFIIVGKGLAANVLAHTFKKNKITFTIIGNPDLSSSSKVAAGIWNPIVFKRLTKSWLADLTIPFINQFYSECEKDLGVKLITKRKLIKPFIQEQEKLLWIKKSKNELESFLDENIYSKNDEEQKNCILSEYGIVKEAANLDIVAFLNSSHDHFIDHSLNENFEYEHLVIESDKISYKDYSAKNIIFCEGYLVKNNPYFNWIPLKPVKGEVLTFSSDHLKIKDSVFNKNGFIMDLGNNLFKAGATYEWDDLTELPTNKGKEELEVKIKQMISCHYQIISHEAGIRPSSIDRRPIIGCHPKYSHLFVFNGLGTKGVMLAPYFANNFVLFYQQKQQINPETDVKRFYHLLSS